MRAPALWRWRPQRTEHAWSLPNTVAHPTDFLDLAEYVDPANVDEIRQAIVRAWESLADNRLRDHVLTNLSWDQSARSLVHAYQKHAPE